MEIIKTIKQLFSKIDYSKLEFKVGQKVLCSECNTCMAMLYTAYIIKFDKFKPAWIRPNGCNWFIVKYKNGVMISLPECVISDYDEQKAKIEKMLIESKHKLGEKGYSIESYIKLQEAYIKLQEAIK